MPDMTEAYEALRKADAAGDTKSAQKLAEYIRSQPNEGQTPSEGVDSVAVHPAEMAADAAKTAGNWFSSNEPEELSLEQAGGAVAGGAASGAAAGAVLPGALKAAGKVIPGVIGKLASGLGEAASAIPLKERVVRGTGGGAAAGAADAAGRAFGAPKALTLAAELGLGGIGETAASFLQKETSQLARFVANASYGNVAGASRALGGMLSPNKPLNEAVARRLQTRLFGNPTEGYVDNLVGSENRLATQEALRKADPTLSGAGPRVAEPQKAPWETSDGEMFPMGGGAGVPTAGPEGQIPLDPRLYSKSEWAQIPFKQRQALTAGGGVERKADGTVTVAPTASTPSSRADDAAAFASGKAGAAAKAAERRAAEQKAEADAAANALRPASQIYRDRMFAGVTDAVKQGKTFSSTPEYAAFEKKLGTLVTLGEVSKSEARSLLQTLQADRLSKQPQVLDRYAETVDNRIRQWGKPAEGGPVSGAAAVDSKIADEVRGALRQAYNGYTSRLGMGDIEQKYRGAYSQEMIAEAKDQLPHFLYGFGTTKEFQKVTRNLARDPEGLPFIQQQLKAHLANQEPKAVVGQFEKLQKVLVDAKLATPTELRQLREAADTVKRATERGEGSVVGMGQRLQQMLLMTMARHGGAEGGVMAGQAAEGWD